MAQDQGRQPVGTLGEARALEPPAHLGEMGPGAVPAEVVDVVHDRGIEVERGQAPVEAGVVAPFGKRRRQAGGTAHGHVPVVGVVRNLLEVQVAGQHG